MFQWVNSLIDSSFKTHKLSMKSLFKGSYLHYIRHQNKSQVGMWILKGMRLQNMVLKEPQKNQEINFGVH